MVEVTRTRLDSSVFEEVTAQAVLKDVVAIAGVGPLSVIAHQAEVATGKEPVVGPARCPVLEQIVDRLPVIIPLPELKAAVGERTFRTGLPSPFVRNGGVV